ncbi:putative reverse transcriptase domain-containing protein [Tanacetum coccineum]
MFSLMWIMPPRVMTQIGGRPVSESRGRGTSVQVGRGGRGKRPREGNDERVDDFELVKENQGLELMGSNVRRSWECDSKWSTSGVSYKEFLACNPKEYDGKGGAVFLTRWIEKMKFVHDMSGCSLDQKVKYTTGSFVDICPSQRNAKSLNLIMELRWSGLAMLRILMRFHELLGMVAAMEPKDNTYEIKIASGQLVEIDKVIKDCKLEIEGHVFDIDLIPFGNGSFDVIIGMDWLSNYKAELICHEKVVRILLPDDKVLRVLGERLEEKARLLMSAKASDKKQEEIVVVRDFPEVFPDDLSGLPPIREIELTPGATPVAKSPYRLAPSELEELSGQLKELQDKGFIRQSSSPWGAPVLFVKKKDGSFRIKANVVADALSRKEKVKPKRVRAMNMTLQSSIKDRIQAAQKEAVDELAGLQRVARHGVPISIISDYDSRFTSRFWQSVQEALGTRLDMSMTYHPQTDGQSERTIQTLEDMLRAVRCAPFEALYGRKCHSPFMWAEVGEGQLIGPELVQETTEKISQIKDRLKCRLGKVWYALGSRESYHLVPLDEIRVDAKLNFVEERVEILEREFKKLKCSRISIVTVRRNSKRGPEFMWKREDQMKLKYPHLFSNVSS